MRKAIKDNLGSFITSIDLKMAKYEANDKAFIEAKAALKEQINRLYAGLEKLDTINDLQRAEKIRTRMLTIAHNDVAKTFAKTIATYLDTVLEYMELEK